MARIGISTGRASGSSWLMGDIFLRGSPAPSKTGKLVSSIAQARSSYPSPLTPRAISLRALRWLKFTSNTVTSTKMAASQFSRSIPGLSHFRKALPGVIEEGPCLYIGYDPCASFEKEVLPYDPKAKWSSDPPRCRYSFIDKQGKRLFENKYPDAKDFVEGLAPGWRRQRTGVGDAGIKRYRVIIPDEVRQG